MSYNSESGRTIGKGEEMILLAALIIVLIIAVMCLTVRLSELQSRVKSLEDREEERLKRYINQNWN